MNIYELTEHIKHFEGFRDKAYQDIAGVWTIGYGRTGNVKKGDTTTREKENEWLQIKVNNLYHDVVSIMISYGYLCTDNQYIALTDFVYNLGMGSLHTLTKDGRRTLNEIANKILEYNKAKVNGELQPVKGLTTRRKWEFDIFTNGQIVEPEEYHYKITDIQQLCNKIIKDNDITDIKPIECDGLIGTKTKDCIFSLLYILGGYI